MTGEISAYASSPAVPATVRMSFPYSDTESWLGFGCNKGSEWAYIGFTAAPNLTGTGTNDGYDSFFSRIKWDDELLRMQFTQEWGSRFIHFSRDSMAIQRLLAGESALLELPWYGEGATLFRYSLQGSTVAILKARGECLGVDGTQGVNVEEASCENWNTEEYFKSATLEQVSACLLAGFDASARSNSDYTPLYWAAIYSDDPSVLDTLVRAGAELSAHNGPLRQMPLHGAAKRNRNPAIIKALLNAGANPDARDKFGSTPLHEAAAWNDNATVVEALMMAGADINARNDISGDMPLHSAATFSKNPAVIELLLDAGADPKARNYIGWTPGESVRDNEALKGLPIYEYLRGL